MTDRSLDEDMLGVGDLSLSAGRQEAYVFEVNFWFMIMLSG